MSRSAAHDARNTLVRETYSDVELARKNAIPTATVIPARAEKLGLAHSVDDVPDSDGARIHWVGDRHAQRVILYYHGGGFGLPSLDGHLMFLASCTEKLAAAGKPTVIAFVEYSLTKTKKYPTPYVQATQALRFVLGQGFKPSNIIVGGDSCGGNMSLALMSIILHGHEAIKPLELSEPLAGLLLISAWVRFQSIAPSYVENVDKDIIMKSQVHEWADDFCTADERNNYTEPFNATASWWQGLPAARTLSVYGAHELFRDDITVLGETMKKAGVNISSVQCPLQVHIEPVLDSQTDFEHGPMSYEIWSWLNTVF